MEIYTTEVIPTAESRPIQKAWTIWTQPGKDLDTTLSELKDKATRGGADAIIGLRLVCTEHPGGEDSRGKWYSGWLTWTAYGTAVKRAPSVTPWVSR